MLEVGRMHATVYTLTVFTYLHDGRYIFWAPTGVQQTFEHKQTTN